MAHNAFVDVGRSYLDDAGAFAAVQDAQTWGDVALESAKELFIPTGFGVAITAGKLIHDWVQPPPPDELDLPTTPDADTEDDSSWTVLARPS